LEDSSGDIHHNVNERGFASVSARSGWNRWSAPKAMLKRIQPKYDFQFDEKREALFHEFLQ
jgi:hypothetical protein